MIINNAHLCGARLRPAKDDPPWVINADGMEAGEIAFEWFKPIARRNGEVGQRSRMVSYSKISNN